MKLRLSISAINMLFRCGEQYRRRYILGQRLMPGFAQALGSSIDDAVTANLRCKMESGALMPDEEIKDLARDAAGCRWIQGVELDEDRPDPKKAEAELVDTSIALSMLHHTEAAPAIQPSHLQRRWLLDVRNFPIELTGIIDIQEGLRAIRDTKTSGKAPDSRAARTSLQLSAYALAVRHCDGALPEEVILDFLVHTKKPKLVQLYDTRRPEDFSSLFERLQQAAVLVERGIFAPANPDAWWCHEKWCGYWRICRYAARPMSVAIERKADVTGTGGGEGSAQNAGTADTGRPA